jgi:hypothetical protein
MGPLPAAAEGYLGGGGSTLDTRGLSVSEHVTPTSAGEHVLLHCRYHKMLRAVHWWECQTDSVWREAVVSPMPHCLALASHALLARGAFTRRNSQHCVWRRPAACGCRSTSLRDSHGRTGQEGQVLEGLRCGETINLSSTRDPPLGIRLPVILVPHRCFAPGQLKPAIRLRLAGRAVISDSRCALTNRIRRSATYIQTSKHPNIQTSKHPSIQASKHPSRFPPILPNLPNLTCLTPFLEISSRSSWSA